MKPFLKTLVWFISTILLALVIRIFVMAVYLVPTPSMEPTILSKDLIMAIKLFAIKHKTPKTNEVWLFSKPDESNDHSLTLVKRLYGAPGDTIQFYNGSIMVNGIPNNMAKFKDNTISAGTLPYPNLMIFPNDTSQVKWTALDFGPLWIPRKGVNIKLNKLSLSLYRKCILDESPELKLTQDGYITQGDSVIEEYTFKQNYYFACGDNLALSNDSRHWGLIPEHHLMSKARLVLFSSYKPISNLSRFFMKIE
ncbi:MAG: signal peptidase I [Tenuifilaceae bacterium]|nr:signal peptidase I [Tenuifilaceae bacterium]